MSAEKVAVTSSVLIAATPERVWTALAEPEQTERWLGGPRLEFGQVGEPVRFSGLFQGKPYRDRGALLALGPSALLRYDHWSAISLVPDTPEHRTLITFTLAPEGDGTRLTVTHERLEPGTNFKHARFFWGTAVLVLKDIVEGARPPC